MEEEDITYINLYCQDCENNCCKLYPNGNYILGEEGCVRKVTQEEKDKYTHYMTEVLPFIKLYINREQKNKAYNEIIDFLSTLYNKPITYRINRKGLMRPTNITN